MVDRSPSLRIPGLDLLLLGGWRGGYIRSEDNLAGLSGGQQLDGILDLLERHLPGNEGAEVHHAAFEQPPGFVPVCPRCGGR